MVDDMIRSGSTSDDENEAGTVVHHLQYLMHELDHSTSYRFITLIDYFSMK